MHVRFWLIIQTSAKHSLWEGVEIMGAPKTYLYSVLGAPTYTAPINKMTSN